MMVMRTSSLAERLKWVSAHSCQRLTSQHALLPSCNDEVVASQVSYAVSARQRTWQVHGVPYKRSSSYFVCACAPTSHDTDMNPSPTLPSSKLWLRLTVGALVLIAASWMFGGIAEDVVHGDPLTLLDVQLAQWFHDHATPQLTRVMLVITHAHDPGWVIVAVLLMAGYLAWKRDWYWLVCLGLTVPLGMLLNILMKFSFQRIRPSFADPLLVVSSYSFPSGHVAGATLFYGVIAAMLVTRLPAWPSRLMVVLAAVGMVMLVALTRMYLGVHYLSDVLAAFAEGIAWLAICFTAMNSLRKR